MGHAIDAHKNRARSIRGSNVESTCGTIVVTEDETEQPTPDPDPDESGFLQENGALIAGAAALAGVAAVVGRR